MGKERYGTTWEARIRVIRSGWDRFTVRTREHLLRRGFLSLGIGLVAAASALALFFLLFAAVLVAGYCGGPGCAASAATARSQVGAFTVLLVLDVVVGATFLIRGVILFVLAAGNRDSSRQR